MINLYYRVKSEQTFPLRNLTGWRRERPEPEECNFPQIRFRFNATRIAFLRAPTYPPLVTVWATPVPISQLKDRSTSAITLGNCEINDLYLNLYQLQKTVWNMYLGSSLLII
jgi:hypothetical protein